MYSLRDMEEMRDKNYNAGMLDGFIYTIVGIGFLVLIWLFCFV